MDQREEPAGEHRHQEPDDPAAAPDRPPDGEEGADEHHPLEPDVHHAGSLAEDAPHRRERERRREPQRRGQQPSREHGLERGLVDSLRPQAAEGAEEPECHRKSSESPLPLAQCGEAEREPAQTEDDRNQGRADRERRHRQHEGGDAEPDADGRDRSDVAVAIDHSGAGSSAVGRPSRR